MKRTMQVLAVCCVGMAMNLAAQTNSFPASGNVGIGTTSPQAALQVVGTSYSLSKQSAVKEFTLAAPDGVANQKFDFYMTGTQAFCGVITVDVIDVFNYQNAVGQISKRFSVGINPQGAVYENESHYTEDSGVTADNWAISALSWDATNSRYKITLVHRVSTGNYPTVRLTAFGHAASDITNFLTFTSGAVYTTDTTAYSRPYVSFNNNVGIGTQLPGYLLDVNGKVHSATGGFVFPDGSTQTTAYTPSSGINIGDNQTKIGYGGIPAFGGLNAGEPIFLSNGGDGGNNQFFYDIYQNYNALYFGVVNFGGASYAGVSPTSFNTLFQINGNGLITTGRPQNTANSSTSNQGIVVSNTLDDGSGDMFVSGNVGIGTTNPNAKLEVNGGLRFSADASGVVQTTAWTGVLCGGDYAESVDVTGDRKKYEPGDVLVIDSNDPSKFQKSAEPYSPAVAGVYSTKPGVTGRRQTTPKGVDELPMAVIGIVPVKVSTENGPIHPSDLLVSSSTRGYAMKGTDRSRMLGAVIGKAMGTLNSGTGEIEVLVSLQ